MQTLTRGEVDITSMYNTINIFGWRFNYNNDFLPSGKATSFDEMKTQIYYAITSSNIDKNSGEPTNIDKNSIISNLAFSQGSIICLRKGEGIIFTLSKSNRDSNRWLLPGIYKVRLWHIKVKNSKVDITIKQYRQHSIPDSTNIIEMELNNHDVRDEIEDEYIYSDLYFKQAGPFEKLAIKNDIHNIYISIKNTSTNKVIVDRLELIPFNS
ncbi:hypothetical protein M5U04_13370 [Xenorhabdus sp. XENO-1]|uniref:delta endotoxin C-terminal domain-containing protein n=1 Tax=Xenorhabdus bovienii TaxID=40576 RepID=UPI0020CA8D3B|nr:delta endotoxin C-terminal domain-containing protein [Xenorhabdus bovienii]MCP9269054.1 hypothetical protein [Xenorhabdus bovienii subsp. africana]